MAEAVVWSVLITRLSAVVLASCGSEVVSWGDLLLVGGTTALVARPYDRGEWDRGSPVVTGGGTNFR